MAPKMLLDFWLNQIRPQLIGLLSWLNFWINKFSLYIHDFFIFAQAFCINNTYLDLLSIAIMPRTFIKEDVWLHLMNKHRYFKERSSVLTSCRGEFGTINIFKIIDAMDCLEKRRGGYSVVDLAKGIFNILIILILI